jgi:hypothetical protein
MIKSKKYWDELLEKSKNEKLEPLEVVPMEEQNKQAKELEKEDKLLLWQMKYQQGVKYE